MHDATVAEKILQTIKGYTNLRTVFVSVGSQSCIRPDMLVQTFNLAKIGTNAEKTELVTMPCPGEEITVLSIEVEDDAKK